MEKELIEHIEIFGPSTTINLTLVNLDARKAFYIYSPSTDLRDFTSYHIQNSKNPKVVENYYKSSKNKVFDIEERDELFIKRTIELVNRYYPKLYIYPILNNNGCIVSKNIIEDIILKLLSDKHKYNPNLLGEVIDYPCSDAYDEDAKMFKQGFTFGINVLTNTLVNEKFKICIFNNMGCSGEKIKVFEDLVVKYERILKSENSIVKDIIDKVYFDFKYVSNIIPFDVSKPRKYVKL